MVVTVTSVTRAGGIRSAGCVAGAGQSPSYLVLPHINPEVRAAS